MLSVADIKQLASHFRMENDIYTPDQDIIDKMKAEDLIADTSELSID